MRRKTLMLLCLGVVLRFATGCGEPASQVEEEPRFLAASELQIGECGGDLSSIEVSSGTAVSCEWWVKILNEGGECLRELEGSVFVFDRLGRRISEDDWKFHPDQKMERGVPYEISGVFFDRSHGLHGRGAGLRQALERAAHWDFSVRVFAEIPC